MMIKRKVCLLMALALMLLSAAALAGEVKLSGICFKYVPDAGRTSVSNTVRGDVSAWQIAQALESGAAYGINCKLTRKASGSADYDGRIVLTAPDGWSYPYTARLSFTASTEYVWFECLGVEFFTAYYSQFGSIEPGSYTVSLYLDGELSDTARFTVK